MEGAMSQECRNKANFEVSICPSGHATLFFGRSALFLEVEELRSLIETAQEVLAQHEGQADKFGEPYPTHLAH